MTTLSIILLLLPTAYHLYFDRNGELPEEKSHDILLMVAIAATAAFIGYLIAGKNMLTGLFLSWAIHFMVFDYAIVYILKKRGMIETKESAFSYLGSSYTDDVLRQWKPWTRFWIKLGVLVGAVIIYIL